MRLFTQKDAEEIVKKAPKEFRYNRDIRMTPGAKDVLTGAGVKLVFDADASSPAVASAAPATAAAPAASGASVDEALYNSPQAEKIKREICDIGRRIWMREYCDANGGNISCRLGPDRYLVTPTGVSKGFMTPEMMCLVDSKGTQLAGTWKRSSEFTSHMAIYDSTPEAVSVCHAHPCYAGAFAIKGLQPPPRLIPELEVFVGTIAYTPYRTPGSPEIASEIRPLAPKHQSILMGNHGVITWGKSVEDAYFKMEITDAYCRTVIHAQSLPGGVSIPGEKMPELLAMKQKMGLPDDRYGLKPAELCEVDPWEQVCGPAGCASPAIAFGHAGGSNEPAAPADVEALVQKLTEEILANLKR